MGKNTNPKTFTAPYNFVPLADEVFFPDWHHQVSHDVPFKDGVSGSFDLVLEAKTPIFSRDDDDEEAFLNVDGQPFIKGSSIRGMLREALKIAAFGKMDSADDNRFAFREFGENSYRQAMATARAGWLTPDRTIVPCEYAKISYKDLKSIQKSRGNSAWSKRDSMPDKYKKWRGSCQQFAEIVKGKNDTFANPLDGAAPGAYEGTIIFTGYVPKKKRDFFFYQSRPEDAYPVSDEVFTDFKQVHRSSQQRPGMDVAGQAPNEHWGHLKEKREDGKKIPVFFRTNNGEVTDLGLASMYRLPSKVSVHGAIANRSDQHLDLSRFDLAELIFGYAADKEDQRGSLKGRVSITHAGLEGDAQRLPKISAALQNPKASFYPAYLNQEDAKRNSITWQDKLAEVSGWKRYPARGHANKNPKRAERDDMNTHFVPLDKGSTFKARVYFHNLRPVELGALLWILDFGAYEEGLVHRLGLARPYGYGEVELRPENFQVQRNAPEVSKGGSGPSTDDFKKAFVSYMRDQISPWLTSDQITYLLAMANPKYGNDRDLKYIKGPGEDGTDEFGKAKRDDEVLPPPKGVDQTRDKLASLVEKMREERAKKKQEAWAKRSPLEKAKAVVNAIYSEQDANDVARAIFDKEDQEYLYTLQNLRVKLDNQNPAFFPLIEEALDSAEVKKAMKKALYATYYDTWSRGKEVTSKGLRGGASKIKEYAEWIDIGDDDDAEEEGRSGPFANLPEEEAQALENIIEREHPKGPLKQFWNNSGKELDWSAEGTREFYVRAEKYLAGKKRKDEKVLDEIRAFVEDHLEELEDG